MRKFGEDGKPNAIPGHKHYRWQQQAFLFFWLGMFGFNE